VAAKIEGRPVLHHLPDVLLERVTGQLTERLINELVDNP
jgi:hypothetical protein